jgi:carboxymethylenebutenolidase
MNEGIRAEAIRLYDRYTHDRMDRREFMARLTRLAGGAAAAETLLIGIAANPAAAQIIAADDPGYAQARSPGRLAKGEG